MATKSEQSPKPEPNTPAERVSSETSQPRTATVNLPFVTAQFRKPEIDLGSAVGAVRSLLPTPMGAVYYGGLAALAAFSVIDWPVAAAIGIGTEIARRGAVEQRPQPAAITA
ncbi:MAG: hypothetical protein ACRDRG_04255 [Pseudonocardiaceae bacterium]